MPPPAENLCGLSCCRPGWLQRFANTKTFIVVYGILGTIQAMSFMYFVVTITTIEKRFKISSKVTGTVLSGNEISQILLSLVLSYAGGRQNRPRWISWGVLFNALSCLVLIVPHILYGAGEDALMLTKEYYETTSIQIPLNASIIVTNTTSNTFDNVNGLCLVRDPNDDDECTDDNLVINYLPLVLIFMSQFFLGIGNSLYYSLGQTYLDDNTKQKNTPRMLSYAMCMRMFGPMMAFVLGRVFLSIYIDPSKTPLIDSSDPRWLGAWWLGWVFIGAALLVMALLIALFPKELPKNEKRHEDLFLKQHPDHYDTTPTSPFVNSLLEIPKNDTFLTALMRLLKNKLLIYNNVSGIFYVLGMTGFMTFFTKYMEVQFLKNAGEVALIAGPITIFAMLPAFLVSGWYISKKKPSASKVLFWNVLVGAIGIVGQFFYLYVHCDMENLGLSDGVLAINNDCNANCGCEDVVFSPVCHVPTGVSYYSPCHAGCNAWSTDDKLFSGCQCLISNMTTASSSVWQANQTQPNFGEIMRPGQCAVGCLGKYIIFALVSVVVNFFGASGKIGNILVNYRAVAKEDKAFSQGLALTLVSLFALIPGPIIFGWIIDSTCLVWNSKCGQQGNCQFYDQDSFRYAINGIGLVLTSLGCFFDYLVWRNGKNLDLYGDKEPKEMRQMNPLLIAKE